MSILSTLVKKSALTSWIELSAILYIVTVKAKLADKAIKKNLFVQILGKFKESPLFCSF